MKLEIGHLYSRDEISRMLGGSIQSFLPMKDGKVVCGCFKTEEKYNPGAPEEVYFGRAWSMPKVEEAAEMVYKQGTPIPVFIFQAAAQWEYIGDYRCVGLSYDPALIAEKLRSYPQRGTMKGILRFEKA